MCSKVRFLGLALSLLVLMLNGCGTAPIEPTDLATIQIGASRETVENVLGSPRASFETETGTRDIYWYNRGWNPAPSSNNAGRDISDCFAYLNILCFPALAIAGGVAHSKHSERYDQQRRQIEIHYDSNGRVTKINGQAMNISPPRDRNSGSCTFIDGEWTCANQ